MVDRALHRLRETTLLMQHLLPPPRAPALGGASLQDRENSVYTTARDTLQEAATWAAPIGRGVEQTGSAEEGSILSSSAHRGDPRGGPQGGAGGVPEEDVMQDEELAARVDDLRRQLQR